MTAALLTVLAVIGKIVLILLLCLAAAAALILFFPVSYRADIKKNAGEFRIQASASWLFRFIKASFTAERVSGRIQTGQDIRVASIPVMSLLRRLKDRKKQTRNTKKAARPVRREASKKPTVKPGQRAAQPAGNKTIAVEVVRAKHPGLLIRLGARVSAWIAKIKRAAVRLRQGREIASDWLIYFGTDSFARAKETLFREGGAILRHVLPKKAEGTVRFGTEDPAATGMISGILFSVYPVLPEKLTVEPVFTEALLDADVTAAGHVILIVLIVRAARILISRDVRKLIARIRKKGGHRGIGNNADSIRKGRGRKWLKTKKTLHFRTT